MVGENAAFDGGAADGEQVGRVPAVAAEELGANAHGPGLLGDQADVVVVVRQEEHVGGDGINLDQLGIEVGGAGGVTLKGHDLAAHLDEFVAEDLGQTLGIVVAGVIQHGRAADVHGLGSVLGGYQALEGVDKASAEDIVANQGDGRIGGRRADHRDALVLGNRGAGQGDLAHDGADDGDDLVLVDQLAPGIGAFGWITLVVLDEGADGHTVDAAGGVDLVEIQLRAIAGGNAEGGGVSRDWRDDTDSYLGGGRCGAVTVFLFTGAGQQDSEHYQSSNCNAKNTTLAHSFPPQEK